MLRVTRWAELRFAASLTNDRLPLASGKLGPLALFTEPNCDESLYYVVRWQSATE
jgi:hypothetical protein